MTEDSNKINLSVWIKKYIKPEYITLITVVLYSWGLLYNYMYYNRFNINIFKYLSLQETLLDTLTYNTPLRVV
ncbi:MAG TPA: hypothetical protein DCR40_04065, partial [Prolixibacteraceae bacterium]|nr:hypothetical protein [Prolixibacteraceae bacterium]